MPDDVRFPTLESYIADITALKDEGYAMCVDLTAVDYLENPTRELPDGIRPERFEVVVNLRGENPHRRVRLRVQVPAADPTVPTLFDLYPGSEAMEREVYDLMGIRFSGHPDLTRILMPEDWEGHPLRKDYSIGAIPVQFKAAPATR
jgi:NADH-quinone oxidoreductase subunit C